MQGQWEPEGKGQLQTGVPVAWAKEESGTAPQASGMRAAPGQGSQRAAALSYPCPENRRCQSAPPQAGKLRLSKDAEA